MARRAESACLLNKVRLSTMIKQKEKTLKDVYVKFKCKDLDDLIEIYTIEDQKLMHASAWDYSNSRLVPNRIMAEIESINLDTITDEYERERLPDLLWFWYHHAISCALWRYGDKVMAFEYSKKALSVQSNKHPNKITKLLHLLIQDDIEGALEWVKTVKDEPEKTSAEYYIDLYKKGNFFRPQV